MFPSFKSCGLNTWFEVESLVEFEERKGIVKSVSRHLSLSEAWINARKPFRFGVGAELIEFKSNRFSVIWAGTGGRLEQTGDRLNFIARAFSSIVGDVKIWSVWEPDERWFTLGSMGSDRGVNDEFCNANWAAACLASLILCPDPVKSLSPISKYAKFRF